MLGSATSFGGSRRLHLAAALRVESLAPSVVRALVVIAILFAGLACDGQLRREPVGPSASSSMVANLHAFARLYGVVRWFHPSDAAAAVDWDRFSIDGVRRVIDARDAVELRARLAELFVPIAPTVHIALAGEVFPDQPTLHPASSEGLDMIAWQHKGYGDSTIATGYASKRLHRDRTVARPGALFASLFQELDATAFRGALVRLRGKLRVGSHARGQLWLRVDRGDVSAFFDNLSQRPVTSNTWTTAEIIGDVATDATRIVFGILNASPGAVWYDDLELSMESKDGAWRRIPIKDAGFEASDPLMSWHTGIGRAPPAKAIEGWRVTTDRGAPASGAASLRVEPLTDIVTAELFAQAPVPSETVDVDLGSGLRARVPIALYTRGGRTIGDDPALARRAQAAMRSSQVAGFSPLVGAADVIVFWNVFEHFWPYWNTVAVDWSTALDVALTAAVADHSVDDHIATLQRLSATAPDGHVGISCPGETQLGYPPFAVELVESQIVVTTSVDSAIERGDVVLSVDGNAATALLTMEQTYVSGSPQWRIVGALQRFANGPSGSKLLMRLRRGGNEIEVSATRVAQRVAERASHSPIERFDDGTYYVDLSRVTMAEIDEMIGQIAVAPGVVFDLRGYPRHNHQVLSYLMTRPYDLKDWELIPLIIRPDSASAPAGWDDTSTWNMPQLLVRQPHIGGRVAFMTGPAAISSAETLMAPVAYYRLGEIVGAATAGTNGDIAQIAMPTGCTSWFTGRRVDRPGGGQHHLIGVQPTISASRTVAGVRAGRDEVLDRALAYVRTGAK
jgi:hypothetical protein